MRILAAALGLALAAGVTAPASAQAFLGTWTATADLGEGNKTSETVTVTKTGDRFSVTAVAIDAPPGAPAAGPGTDVALTGDTFFYTRNFTGTDIILTYTGVVTGDTFTGTAQLGETKIPYTGVRVRAAK